MSRGPPAIDAPHGGRDGGRFDNCGANRLVRIVDARRCRRPIRHARVRPRRPQLPAAIAVAGGVCDHTRRQREHEIDCAQRGLTVADHFRCCRRGATASRDALERMWAQAPNNGFLGGWTTTKTLRPGTMIDRYGGEVGRFFSPAGTPFEARGCLLAQVRSTHIGYSNPSTCKLVSRLQHSASQGSASSTWRHKSSPISSRAALSSRFRHESR